MFQFKRLVPHAIIPTRGSPHSAGLDLSASENVVIEPQSWCAVSTGLAFSIPNDAYGRIAPRSGLALKHGIDVFAGVIDCDYLGEIKVILMNNSPHKKFVVNFGDRIAQLIIEKIYIPDFVVVEELQKTKRGTDGFGSTGLKATQD